MKPSPYFKIVMAVLIALVGVVALLLSNVAASAERKAARAPLVAATPKDGVMAQTGWITYEEREDAVVLYCVPQGDAKLSCVVYITSPEGNSIVVMSDLSTEETSS